MVVWLSRGVVLVLREIASIHALMATPGVGYVAAGNAMRAASEAGESISELLGRSSADLTKLLPVDAAQTIGRCDASQLGRFERMLERLYSAGGQSLMVSEPDYPEALRTALGKNAPPVVSVLGNLGLLNTEHGGIVGARDASPESRGYAADCARHFSERDVGVVSGAARGIDDVAHGTALECGGTSVFVLPHGILRYRGGDSVREALEDGRAVLISEFAPDAAWASHAAIMRNKTIAAFAKVLCVFEPRGTGGSIRTAEVGLAQAKPVLVHCLGGEWRVEQRLIASGARTLPVHDTAAMRKILDGAWDAEGRRRTEQQELF